MSRTASEAPTRSRLLTVPEAAGTLSVSASWVRRHLPLLTLGDGQRGRSRVQRVRRADVEAVLRRAEHVADQLPAQRQEEPRDAP